MSVEREFGTLWLGRHLSWFEQLCLTSFVDHGQRITLFSYHPLAQVPKGVISRDAADILGADRLEAAGLSGPAGGPVGGFGGGLTNELFTDLFRLHMLQACAGMIWVNSDILCHARFAADGPFIFGHEIAGRARISAAVLGLPADSAVLADMLFQVSDPFAIPPYLKPERRRALALAKAAGQPVHVSLQPPGVWAGHLLTHYLGKHRLADLAQPPEVFCPVPAAERKLILRRQSKAAALISGNTVLIALHAANKPDLTLQSGGLPVAGSYLAGLLSQHGINPDAAPLAGPTLGSDAPDLLGRTGLNDVARFADIGGTAIDLALAAHERFDCDIVLVDVDGRGGFPAVPSGWVAPYRAALAVAGVAASRISEVRSAAALKPCDLVANLAGYGDHHKIRGIAPLLNSCLHADSRLLLDLRKGSGSFPFLAGFGTCEVVSRRSEAGHEVARVLFTPKAPEMVPDDGSWAAIARGLAGPDGFYRANDTHSFLHIPRGRTLVVTFDNLDIAMNKREDRRPWGFSFIEKQGWSMLGVMANGWTWYRDPWVSDQFDELAASGFFAGFERVVFYGASMGGYAACAFSGAAPGADVVAISPQSTVDRAVVPWETRYRTVWGADFSGKYGDAALVSGAARRVTLLYDPFEPLDAGHVDRFAAPNVMKLRANLLGHRLGSSLQQMGILTPIILGALGGSLSEAEFYRTLRARKTFGRYQRELFTRLINANHPKLAKRLGAYILGQGDNRFIRQEMLAL